ncbi:MAG: hypothetical protein LUE98_16170 [Tannerellaceae bacterium]|nr:hypothetical protein [Tannerellaceae bacterium]
MSKFLLGVAAGVAAAYVVSKKMDKATMDKMCDSTSEFFDKAKQKVKEGWDKTKDQTENLADRTTDAMSNS